ncbi:methionyl-tRNA formyltransferase [Actinobacteria bacterium YIM 96077]|uniref:Methionyl-tRNA formyltransferase n=1 Tax=Phytoactinopolyspora halophila TaxID=1981511 RepID=A0A329QPF4_9ACTN|nr:methionyl-tRNA formyltransferase [Phytoactinopolyspora halophila]AYY12968.1 methionyl-tRNA formyltransferase [Actinobacteria bacterium YIM 96077]RAW13232.1 methionyl-tRNA formyltransferase [Phytoactinopolyspora halophila]
MRVLFAGTPETAIPSLRALLASRHTVVAVLTRPDARVGRGRKLARSPIGAVADEAGIEVLTPTKPRDPEFLARLGELAPDCAPIVAYGGLIPPAALEIPKHGWVNLHFSLLPAWRGAAPVQHAILAGDEMTGATTFLLEEGLDTGPVYGLVTEEIRPSDTSGDVLERLSESGAELLVRTLDGIEDGTLRAEPQQGDGVSYAPKITVEDAAVDWSSPALHIDRLVRACTPAPGAWTTFRGERLKIGPIALEPDRHDLEPGAMLVEKGRIHVGTGSHAVVLGDVQPQGKRAMPADAWARGTRPETGERLGDAA